MTSEIFENGECKIVIFTGIENKDELLPLTANRSSSLLTVSDKTILEWIISNCKKVGFNEFIVLVSIENKDDIEQIILKYNNNNTQTEPIKCNFIEFNPRKGFTRENRTVLIESLLPQQSLWIDSETLFSEKFIADFVRKLKGFARFALVNTKGNTQNFCGIGYFDKKNLENNLLGAKNLNDIFERINKKSTNLVPTLELEDKMEFWRINYLWNLLDANQILFDYLEEKNEGIIEEGVKIIGKVRIEAGARIRSGSYIEGPVYIGKECDVGPNCFLRKGVALQAKVRIGNACELKNTLVYEGSHIAHLSYVGDSIIGQNCNFGAGTITGNLRLDDVTIRAQSFSGEVLSTERRKLGVIMGDNVKTAINTYFMPGVIVGNNSAIGTGVIVQRNIPDNTFVYVEQQLVSREWEKESKK